MKPASSTLADGPPALEPIAVPKSCDVLADRLRAHIMRGKYAEGASLPTERELVDQTGLSRGSVREALRILQTEGLVQTRPGRHGGTVVLRPSHDQLARHVRLFAQGRGIELQALLETREALEPMLAQLAARNRTTQDLVALREAQRRLVAVADDVPRFLEENVHWHYTLALASHNDLLLAFMRSIASLVHDATEIENLASEDVRSLVVRAHQRILDAVEKRDAEAARRRMERHVKAYSKQVNVVLQGNAARRTR